MIPTRRLLRCLLLTFIFVAAASPLEPQKYWIFFRDKGQTPLAKGSAAYREAENRLNPRALARRAKVMPQGRLITEEDVPVAAEYLSELQKRGFEVINQSRWLNAVSIIATEDETTALRGLPFVKEVRAVKWMAHPRPLETGLAPEPPPLLKAAAHRLDYGASLAQNEQISVTTLHDAGINGAGVLVGMMDSGFRWQNHEAFQHLLEGGVVAERDFVNNDGITRNQIGDSQDQDHHGTQTLSILGGYKPGQLIGPAYGAKFVLAKTELVPGDDLHAEEDYWAAAVEWMEGFGVDVTSTSLGYSNYFAAGQDYTPSDMDGKTTIITKAAELAVSRGVVVVNATGNQGQASWRIIGAPADGEHVIAVGGVNSAGSLASFSGRGPSADGRIKPDVVARAIDVRKVVPTSTSFYDDFVDGTSLSCPLVAGVVAQMLSVHPDLTPAQVMEALRNTASRANAPDNDYGYGIVNAKAAITYWGPAFSNFPEVQPISPGELEVTVRILSTAGLQNNQTKIYYAIGATSTFTPVAMTQLDSISYTGIIPQTAANDTIKLYFSTREINATTDAIYPKNAPSDFLRILGSGAIVGVDPPRLPVDFAVLQSFPNPARLAAEAMTLRFQLVTTGAVSVKVFNLLGQEVATLAVNRVFSAGTFHDLVWDGRDNAGKTVPGGIYFFQVSAISQQATHKMLFMP